MTFLFEPPQPADFVGGSWGNLEIMPHWGAPTGRIWIEQFSGISDDNFYHFNITSRIEIDCTVVGGGPNKLDTGTLAGPKNYYIWVIGDSTGANPDAGLVSLSYTNPAMPSPYDKKRLIGSITTDSSPALRPIRKVNDMVFHCDPILLINNMSSTFGWTTQSVGIYTSQFARKAILNSYIDSSTALDGFGEYKARPSFYTATYSQYYMNSGINVQGADSGYSHQSQSGVVDLRVTGTSDPPTIDFAHTKTGSAVTLFLWLVGFQEILP